MWRNGLDKTDSELSPLVNPCEHGNKERVVFCDITPCNPLKSNKYFGDRCRLHLQGRRISQEETSMKLVASRPCLIYFSILKLYATCSSETSVNFQRNTRRYIPED
jgi:hypothetical protein